MSVKVDELIGSKGSISVDDLIDLLSNLSNSSQVGEDILRAPLAVDVRSILQLVKQTSLVDITAGRMLEVGSFGLGANANAGSPRLNNIDDLSIPNGFYYADTNSVGTFPGGLAARGMILVERYPATNTLFQTFKYPGADTSISNNEFVRSYNTSTNSWNAWSRVYNSSSILGIVSQVNGLPTGAVIERGSNANGDYVRFADGTQICWGVAPQAQTVNQAGNLIFFSGNVAFNFPASFSAIPCVAGNTSDHSISYSWVASTVTPSLTGSGWVLVSTGQNATARFRWIATGRWY